jgi:RND superfamily putative drug exporter
MARIARWCFRHRYIVISSWVIGLLALGGAAAVAGSGYNDSYLLAGTESTKAYQLLQQSFPSQSGDNETIVWRVDAGSATDVAIRERIGEMLGQVERADRVAGVRSPYTSSDTRTGGATQISQDGRTAYATVIFDGRLEEIPVSAYANVVDIAQRARADGLQVELGGLGIGRTQEREASTSELVGVIAAAGVLFIAFGSLLSTLLPLISAVLALGASLAAVGLLAHVITIATFSPTLATLIGLGVGIDYALFVITRHRNAIKAGRPPEDAAVIALDTAGRAVLCAGATVCVALLGLVVLRVGFLNGAAIAAAITVVFTMAAATTLLPALLGVIGKRVLSRRERRLRAAEVPHDPHAEGFWARWARYTQRRPAGLAILAAAVMAVLAIPLFSLRLGSSDQGNDPAAATTRKAYDLLAEAFGAGFNGPLQLVAETPRGNADQAALETLSQTVCDTPGVASVSPAIPNEAGSVAIIQVVPTTSPQDVETSELISELRDDVVPRATAGTDVRVYVGGLTAVADDFASVIGAELPLFIGVIVTMGGLLLLAAFRSLLIAAVAAVMNLLAAGASLGIVTAIFQWGWGAAALGAVAGPIESFAPVMMLAILFGLSMDYQVFLVSRMHEDWVRERDNRRAILVGQASTGRVITAAATIMVLVFGSFVFGGQRFIAEFGIGLATAILLDAFVLRTALVPATMHLIGPANWWIPRWLDRVLPHLSAEPPERRRAGRHGPGQPRLRLRRRRPPARHRRVQPQAGDRGAARRTPDPHRPGQRR